MIVLFYNISLILNLVLAFCLLFSSRKYRFIMFAYNKLLLEHNKLLMKLRMEIKK